VSAAAGRTTVSEHLPWMVKAFGSNGSPDPSQTRRVFRRPFHRHRGGRPRGVAEGPRDRRAPVPSTWRESPTSTARGRRSCWRWNRALIATGERWRFGARTRKRQASLSLVDWEALVRLPPPRCPTCRSKLAAQVGVAAFQNRRGNAEPEPVQRRVVAISLVRGVVKRRTRWRGGVPADSRPPASTQPRSSR